MVMDLSLSLVSRLYMYDMPLRSLCIAIVFI